MKIRREKMRTTKNRTKDKIQHAQLWAEIELPKFLKDLEQPIRKEVIKHE
jgi:hypothetical protein